MLIRHTTDDLLECIYQEHHALLSGLLAAAWTPTPLEPRLIQAIGLHDTPWRRADAHPIFNEQSGLPHDFITYPHPEKFAFYRSGIDVLETIDPFTALLVSRRYSAFADSAKAKIFRSTEEARRKRLFTMLVEVSEEEIEEGLKWVNFFDTFSLYLCLAGPDARPESIPDWLVPTEGWAIAPDETELEFEWLDDETLELKPWPFSFSEISARTHFARLTERTNAEELESAWTSADKGVRDILLIAARP